MKVSEKIKKFQEGGAAPAPQAAPADPAAQGGGEQDPMVQLLQIAQQALEGKDCDAAMAVCDGLLQLVAQSQGGGQAPAGGAPADGSQPVFKRGGKLVKRI
jgi:hypothetical protein